jgi:hypothetical protein
MKNIGVWWFVSGSRPVGVVLAENEIKEKKLYIKAVDGMDEKADIREVMDYGSKITVKMLKDMMMGLGEE